MKFVMYVDVCIDIETRAPSHVGNLFQCQILSPNVISVSDCVVKCIRLVVACLEMLLYLLLKVVGSQKTQA